MYAGLGKPNLLKTASLSLPLDEFYRGLDGIGTLQEMDSGINPSKLDETFRHTPSVHNISEGLSLHVNHITVSRLFVKDVLPGVINSPHWDFRYFRPDFLEGAKIHHILRFTDAARI
jgi:hypothetical protein